MKNIIFYCSIHQNNTKKVVEAIANDNLDLTIVNLLDKTDPRHINLNDYDLIGFASGIYKGKVH